MDINSWVWNSLIKGENDRTKIKGKVLIICNHNSARSQIAEGLLKSLYGEYYVFIVLEVILLL